MRLIIDIVGRPAPQGSKKTGGAGQLLEASAYLPAWRAAIRIGAYKAYAKAGIVSNALPVFGPGVPLWIERLTFYMGPEQCRADGTHLPIGTPDIDKLLRSTLDGLGGRKGRSARLFHDDSQIVAIDGLRKVRYPGAARIGASIIITDEHEEGRE